MEDGRAGMQYGKLATAHPTSPSMPSPITPADGSSFYPTATDVDGRGLMLSPRFSDIKRATLNGPTVKPDQHPGAVAPYSQFQLIPSSSVQLPSATVQPQQLATATASQIPDLDDIDALQFQWDMEHFEPGKLTESDLICLDTSASSALVTTAATSVFTPNSTTVPLMTDTAADMPASFPIFSSPIYHPYYQQQPQQVFSTELNLDYSTPEVKELLCTGWLESDLLNVN